MTPRCDHGVPQTGGALQGIDVALLGTLPTALALWVGSWTDGLVGAQAVLAAACAIGVVMYVGRRDRR